MDTKLTGSLDYCKIIAAFLVIAIHTSPLASFSAGADFVLTRIMARTAVPFFLMVTGYFLLPQYVFGKSMDDRPLLRFVQKTLLLYAAAILLFLPVNIYAGQLENMKAADFIRMLLFDGTFYHLWYLPASITGVLLLWRLGKKFSFQTLFMISLALYGFGLFGDSYYGFTRKLPAVNHLYNALFYISSYTRNGIFYVPVFLAMGAWFGHTTPYPFCVSAYSGNRKRRFHLYGFLISLLLLILEGISLCMLQVQRHDSMYLFLLPCMFFLFSVVLSVKKQPVPVFRSISARIYLLHPMMIILVRGMAKMMHCQAVLVDNSLVHYLSVCLLSGTAAWMTGKYFPFHKRRYDPKGRAWIEVDRKKLCRNVSVLKDLLPPGCKLMPVVKANAYGHGADLISGTLNQIGIDSFCVASVSEGIELRKGGICGEILILGYTHPEYFPLLKKYDLTQTVINSRYAKLLNEYGKPVKVHIKIDTGMHRLGERAEHAEEIAGMFEMKNLIIKGIYTHLCADESAAPKDRAFTEAQGRAFYQVVSALRERGCSCPSVHLLASCGLINYPELSGDYARTGIALYGVLSSRDGMERCSVPLHPVLSVKARIAAVRDIFPGESVGYGRTCTAAEKRKIAVLSIGYADGLPRALSCGKGSVLVNGRRAPITGRICMDQTIIDITGIPGVREGDIAVVIGRSGGEEITVYDIAEQTGTITNEILSRLGARLDRIPV